MNRWGIPAFVTVALLFFGLPLVRGAGYSGAATQTQFPIYVIDEGSFAVVDIQEGQIIGVGFDEKTSQLTGKVLLVPINGPLILENKKVGPLKAIARR